MKRTVASLQKGSIKLIEYSEGTIEYSDKLFIQSGCVGFYMTLEELKNLKSIIDYYLNIDEFMDIRLNVDGENVAL